MATVYSAIAANADLLSVLSVLAIISEGGSEGGREYVTSYRTEKKHMSETSLSKKHLY